MLLNVILLQHSLLLSRDFKSRMHHHGRSSHAGTAEVAKRSFSARWGTGSFPVPPSPSLTSLLLLLKLCYECHSKDTHHNADRPPRVSPHVWCLDQSCPRTGVFSKTQGKQNLGTVGLPPSISGSSTEGRNHPTELVFCKLAADKIYNFAYAFPSLEQLLVVFFKTCIF